MPKQTQIDKAIAKLQGQLEVIEKAIAVLREQQKSTAPRVKKPRPVAVNE